MDENKDLGKKTGWRIPLTDYLGYDPDEALVDIDTVAAFLKVSSRTVHRWIRDEDLPCFRIGGALRFQIREILIWLEQYRVKGATTRQEEEE